jgi:neutral ceramidase
MLQVGFGIEDISPDVGMEMPGGFTRRTGTGIRDRLLAVACVVTDGTSTVALVGIDTLFIIKDTVTTARRIITKETKIPGENVLIGASHTHSGGPVASCLGSDENPVYTERLAKGIAAAVKTGWSTLHAAEIAIGTGHEPGISFNRRFLMRDGREITHPGKPGTSHHNDIVAPAGPIDPDVGILAVRDPLTGPGKGGKVRGIVVNFACHSTVVGGDQFSPDYAGYLRKHLRAFYGPTTPICFLLGPCGDITQVDNQNTSKDFGPEHADMMGMKLAGETIRTINRSSWLKEAVVVAAVEQVQVSIRPEPDAVRERPAFGLGSDSTKDGKIDSTYAQERKRVAEMREKNPILLCEVQALRIGPLGIATNGAEYFCEYGLRIKKASMHPTTWVSSLTNEWIGYVPTAQAFVGGGYETRTARSSKLAHDAGQRLVEGALKALDRVAPKVEEKKAE